MSAKTVDHNAVRRAMRRGADRIAADQLYLGPSRPLKAQPDVTTPAPVVELGRGFGICGHFPPCPAPAVAGYLIGPRCAAHTPASIAGRPEVRPDPARTVEGLARRAAAS